MAHYLSALSLLPSEWVRESCSVVSNSLRPHGILHGILQARILEWVAVPFSRGSFQPRDQTQVSGIAGIPLEKAPFPCMGAWLVPWWRGLGRHWLDCRHSLIQWSEKQVILHLAFPAKKSWEDSQQFCMAHVSIPGPIAMSRKTANWAPQNPLVKLIESINIRRRKKERWIDKSFCASFCVDS